MAQKCRYLEYETKYLNHDHLTCIELAIGHSNACYRLGKGTLECLLVSGFDLGCFCLLRSKLSVMLLLSLSCSLKTRMNLSTTLLKTLSTMTTTTKRKTTTVCSSGQSRRMKRPN